MQFDIILPSIGRLSLFQAVESVIHQDHKDWRLWIVCDGINRLESAIGDSRITVLEGHGPRHEDMGAWARNAGIAAGTNPWIAYIDDDDVYLSHHLSTISSLLEASPHATMVRTAGQAFSWRHKSPRSKEKKRKLGAVNNTDILTVGMAHTRESFNKTNGWQAGTAHDKDLWNKMLSNGGVSIMTDQVTFQFAR